MFTIGYYPGCSLKNTAREYDESLHAIAHGIGMELVHLHDWNCCGATVAHSISADLALALPARILAIAEKAGIGEVLVPCSACYNRLMTTRHELLADEKLREKISGVIEMEYTGSAKVLNIIEVMHRLLSNGMNDRLTRVFDKKVACYYGCYLTRPKNILHSNCAEYPLMMDDIMKRIGADPIDWEFKVECCGAGFSVSRTETVARLSGKILADAVKRGAEAIIVSCPMCHANLDLRRDEITRITGKKYDIPVLYVPQAVGMALGIDHKKLGLHRHFVPVKLKLDTIANGTAEIQADAAAAR